MENAGSIIIISWMLVAPSLSSSNFERSRLPTFLSVATIALWNIAFLRSPKVLDSISNGLNAVISTVLAANFILLYDIRTMRRLTLRATGISRSASNYGAKERHASMSNAGHTLTWQSIPASLSSRVFWVLDLLTSLRGIHWAWSLIEEPSRYGTLSKAYSIAGQQRNYVKNIARLIVDYLILDLVKCVMLSDPYFNGISTATPPLYLSRFITSETRLYTYRILLALSGVCIAIEIEYTLVLVVFVNVLGPLGMGISGSPIAFPPIWGSPWAVCRKGLRGFWGETWHQLFRRHFANVGDAVAQFILRKTGKDSAPIKEDDSRLKRADTINSSSRVMLRYTIVFLISALLHAAASHTLRGPTKPWRSFLSFALQPVGIAFQSACSSIFVDRGVLGPTGRQTTIRYVFNLAFTVTWLWATMGMVLQDLTTGHMWMIEPVPVSLIHGLGLVEDQKCWRW